MSMQAGFEALVTEAAEWDSTSDALSSAAGTVGGLGLTSADFSGLASTTGVDSSYEDARRFVQEVMEAGARETTEIANALRQIRADFDSIDQSVRDRVSANWVPE